MLGYKIYFNGDKFVADNTATEVQTMPCDSTVSWMANKTYADNVVEKHNANDLKDVKKCKECGKYFWQTNDEKKKIDTIRQIIDESIDFSQPKLPRYIIDRFISKVVVLDNNKFRWYLTLGDNPDDDMYIDAQVEGRKNNSSVQILSSEDSLLTFHSSTGSNR